MFGKGELLANTNEFVSNPDLKIGFSGGSSFLTTVALVDDDNNPALGQVPYREGTLFAVKFDQRGSPRPQPDEGFFDVGAFEAAKSEGSGDSPTGGEYVDSVKMGGIPNRMMKVGERCSLVATVFPTRASQEVTWSSTNPSVATIDQYGSLRSRSIGTTTITVTTVGVKPGRVPEHATDSVLLEVKEDASNVVVAPGIEAKLTSFNAGLEQYDEQVYFVDADPATVSAVSFQSAFKSAWGVAPSQVTELPNASAIFFGSTLAYTGNNWVSAKPSINVSLTSLPFAGGSLLPLEYTWSMRWDEVSKIMGRTVTNIDSVEALFQNLKLVFGGVDGVATPVVDADGAYGVAVSRAVSSGALEVTSGNNGLTLRLRVMMGDVNAAVDGKPVLIDNNLVVADGVANGTAGGDMWLLKRAGGGDSGSSGGGGGCNVGFGMAFVALASAFALRRGTSGRKPE
jgi:hypothetical protein